MSRPRVASKSIDVLTDPAASVRVVSALKSGAAPREGIRYLSVGFEKTESRILAALDAAANGSRQHHWIVADPGEGKSHLMRLLAAAAIDRGFACAFLVHDPTTFIGMHKPLWMMRRLLWELQWSHPNLDMGPYYWQMVGRPTYALDRDTRESLPRRLGQLVSHLREQGFSGLVLVIDEFESFLDLAGNQRPIFQYVFNNLLNSVPENCLLAFASTTALSDTLEWLFKRPLTPRFESPVLTKEHALEIAKRVSKLHATAFSWEPPVKPSDLVEYAWRKVSLAVSGKWRAYIQMVLRQLEILEQSRHTPSAPHLRARAQIT